MNLFEYQDYRTFVTNWMEARERSRRGLRTQMAKAMGCQLSYFSQVLSGKADLSTEQALLLGKFIGLLPLELEFFLTLVAHARAGHSELKSFYRSKLLSLQDSSRELGKRLTYDKSLRENDQAVYYSQWYYSSIHVMLGIERYQNLNNIAKDLSLPLVRVREVVDFLVRAGLVSQTEKGYQVIARSVHLSRQSPFLALHHALWRNRAIHSLGSEAEGDLHYSSVISIAEKDIPAIRAALTAAIENVRAIVGPSVDETVCSYGIDFFRVIPRSVSSSS